MSLDSIITCSYIVGSILFIFGLKMLGSPTYARKGNLVSSVGMLIAIVATVVDIWMKHPNISHQWLWIIIGVTVGSVIGILAARFVAITAMPEMVALLNGFGGLASLLVGWASHLQMLPLDPELTAKIVETTGKQPSMDGFTSASIALTILIGGVTFSGSMIAWAKLKEVMTGRPILYPGQNWVNAAVLFIGAVGCVVYSIMPGDCYILLLALIGLALILGITSTIPIGGADMPVVISLLNSYSGMAAMTAGFVIKNTILIVAGSLVGASGIILTVIMCKAMNRSLANVLFSGFGAAAGKMAAVQGEVKSLTAKDAYYLLDNASSVVFVPGYGLAVAQAQRTVRELGDLLEKRNCEVRYAIHPVAGRMPGHMNVLLAEADVPYEQLVEMDTINPSMPAVDVCIVVGANDVVNPSAREDKNSPLYGMPIIDADKAKVTIVLKRSMRAGFAGVDNPLFLKPNTRMLFGDAKNTLQALVNELKEA